MFPAWSKVNGRSNEIAIWEPAKLRCTWVSSWIFSVVEICFVNLFCLIYISRNKYTAHFTGESIVPVAVPNIVHLILYSLQHLEIILGILGLRWINTEGFKIYCCGLATILLWIAVNSTFRIYNNIFLTNSKITDWFYHYVKHDINNLYIYNF